MDACKSRPGLYSNHLIFWARYKIAASKAKLKNSYVFRGNCGWFVPITWGTDCMQKSPSAFLKIIYEVWGFFSSHWLAQGLIYDMENLSHELTLVCHKFDEAWVADWTKNLSPLLHSSVLEMNTCFGSSVASLSTFFSPSFGNIKHYINIAASVSFASANDLVKSMPSYHCSFFGLNSFCSNRDNDDLSRSHTCNPSNVAGAQGIRKDSFGSLCCTATNICPNKCLQHPFLSTFQLHSFCWHLKTS